MEISSGLCLPKTMHIGQSGPRFIHAGQRMGAGQLFGKDTGQRGKHELRFLELKKTEKEGTSQG